MGARVDRETMRAEIAGTRPGSLVEVIDHADRRLMGTLLSSEPHGIVLLNCICKDVIPAPEGQKQLRTSHRPFQSMVSESITNFRVMASPPRNWRADDRPGSTAEAVVLKSGRRLSCLPRSGKDVSRQGDPATDEALRRDLANMPAGSRIAVIDKHGQQFQATLLSKSSESVEFMNCITRQTVLDPWGHDQTQISHTPFQSCLISSLVACELLAPPSVDVPASILGEDCQEYIVTGFVYENGHYQSWGKLSEPASSLQETASPGVASVFLRRQ